MQKIIEGGGKSLLKIAIRGYQTLLSPIIGNNCRFHPSCSAYAIEAIDSHGVINGLWLSIQRIARCNPWSGGGLDPVPLPNNKIPGSSGDVLKNDR